MATKKAPELQESAYEDMLKEINLSTLEEITKEDI